jgi:alkylation response protein AidB-like acyl-CoA dehydrogenase
MGLLGFERGEEAAINPVLFRAELDRLIAVAQERGLTDDPFVRNRLADCLARVEVMRFIGQQILAQLQSGGPIGASASVSKLQWSEYHQRITELALDLLGLDGLVLNGRPPLRHFRADDQGVPIDATTSWNSVWMNAIAGTIYAGTSEVQRNILAETVLGLPKESRG